MKKLIISESEKNNILNKYYTKFRLDEVDTYDTSPGITPPPAPTTTTPKAPVKNYTIQELQQLLGFTGASVDGKAGPNTLAAIENALRTKGTLPPATGGAANTQTPQGSNVVEKPKELSSTPLQTKTAANIDPKTGTVVTTSTGTPQTNQNKDSNVSTTGGDPNAD